MNGQLRRIWFILLVLVAGGVQAAQAAEPVEIGSRLELFVDRHLVDRLEGAARLELQRPKPQEVVLVTDKPWEGNTCAYYTVFRDGDRFRMYYRGSHHDGETRKSAHPAVTCYAESKDGLHWTKPELGLFEFEGSKANNIVWDGIGAHCFTPFKDANPDCPPEVRYKAVGRGRPKGKKGLYVFGSPDGIRWKLLAEKPVITKGAFDSQNLAFWDPHEKTYRSYHRGFRSGVRDILTATSADFLTWSEPEYLAYPGAPKEHLYTNAIFPYPRGPHLLIGFPTRYQPKRGSQVEPILMSSRDRHTFHRWQEPLIPVTAPQDRDGNRSNYMAWGLLQLPGQEREYSVYATEAYYRGPDSRLRRFTYRVDGFVSVQASEKPGELFTKQLTFAGKQLVVNFRTRQSGKLAVELQTAEGETLDGFALSDCQPLQGDAIEQAVRWKGSSNLADLAGRPVRLRFVLEDAELFSLRFR